MHSSARKNSLLPLLRRRGPGRGGRLTPHKLPCGRTHSTTPPQNPSFGLTPGSPIPIILQPPPAQLSPAKSPSKTHTIPPKNPLTPGSASPRLITTPHPGPALASVSAAAPTLSSAPTPLSARTLAVAASVASEPTPPTAASADSAAAFPHKSTGNETQNSTSSGVAQIMKVRS